MFELKVQFVVRDSGKMQPEGVSFMSVPLDMSVPNYLLLMGQVADGIDTGGIIEATFPGISG